MKTLLTLLLSLAAGTARAHESLVPHHHPHGVSMLPGLDTILVGAIFAIAIAFLVYAKFRRS
jgi:H+/gluconate symporter-like permease